MKLVVQFRSGYVVQSVEFLDGPGPDYAAQEVKFLLENAATITFRASAGRVVARCDAIEAVQVVE